MTTCKLVSFVSLKLTCSRFGRNPFVILSYCWVHCTVSSTALFFSKSHPLTYKAGQPHVGSRPSSCRTATATHSEQLFWFYQGQQNVAYNLFNKAADSNQRLLLISKTQNCSWTMVHGVRISLLWTDYQVSMSKTIESRKLAVRVASLPSSSDNLMRTIQAWFQLSCCKKLHFSKSNFVICNRALEVSVEPEKLWFLKLSNQIMIPCTGDITIITEVARISRGNYQLSTETWATFRSCLTFEYYRWSVGSSFQVRTWLNKVQRSVFSICWRMSECQFPSCVATVQANMDVSSLRVVLVWLCYVNLPLCEWMNPTLQNNVGPLY